MQIHVEYVKVVQCPNTDALFIPYVIVALMMIRGHVAVVFKERKNDSKNAFNDLITILCN